MAKQTVKHDEKQVPGTASISMSSSYLFLATSNAASHMTAISLSTPRFRIPKNQALEYCTPLKPRLNEPRLVLACHVPAADDYLSLPLSLVLFRTDPGAIEDVPESRVT